VLTFNEKSEAIMEAIDLVNDALDEIADIAKEDAAFGRYVYEKLSSCVDSGNPYDMSLQKYLERINDQT